MKINNNKSKIILVYIVIFLGMFSCPTIYFHFTPLPSFDLALTTYTGQIPVVLGGRDGFYSGQSYHRRNYILIPSFFHDPKFIRVTQISNDKPKITEENAIFELLVLFIFFVISLFHIYRSRSKNK